MKSLWNLIVTFGESVAKARTAAYFSRHGRHDLAKEIMVKD